MILILIFFLLFPPFLTAGESGIHPGADFKKLLNRPATISSSIRLLDGPNREHWIHMKADVHVVADASLKELRPTVFAWDNYPKMFFRMKENWIEQSSRGELFTMHLSVGLMGIYYDTTYTLLVSRVIDTPSVLQVDFSPENGIDNYISADGTVRRPHGVWYFEEITLDGKTAVYIRYTADGEVLKKYPLQDTVMDIFVNLEHEELLTQFLKAARKNKKNRLS